MKRFLYTVLTSVFGLAISVAYAAPQKMFLDYIRKNNLTRSRFQCVSVTGETDNAPVAIFRDSSIDFKGGALQFGMCSFQPKFNDYVTNQIRVKYKYEIGAPAQLNLVADGLVKVIPITNKRKTTFVNPEQQELARMWGVRDYYCWLCWIDFSAENSERVDFKDIQALTITTEEGDIIPLFVKEKNKKHYSEVQKKLNDGFSHFRIFNGWSSRSKEKSHS